MLTCEHGGNLDRAISQFGGNRKEWIDLSTGINPYTYNVFDRYIFYKTIKPIRTIIRKLIVIIKRNKLKFDLLKSPSSSRTSNDLFCCIDD